MQKKHPLREADVTAESVFFMQRRQILKALGIGAAAATLSSPTQANLLDWFKGNDRPPAPAGKALEFTKPERWQNSLPLTPEEKVTGYNNFYEFGLDKDDPQKYAQSLATRPWTLRVEGLVNKPMSFDLDQLLKLSAQEERIYRLRCVEGWSMVIPWIGYSLSKLLAQVQPLGSAKYVEFVTLADSKTMPGIRSRVLDWPYTEGLRLDEAMHPLTLLGFGMYGHELPRQNGAPVRLVVPWKYGFKSAKSIVSIRLVEKEPGTAWNKAARNEYGFYSNVNPDVPHPRWSQATERRIGEGGLFTPKRKTLLFNGYEAQVGQLYAGMDLRKNY